VARHCGPCLYAEIAVPLTPRPPQIAGRKMAFTTMKLKPESGASRIKSADDAYSFMVHMRLSYQNKPHWQVARQALNNAGASDECKIKAWRSFRAAASTEGWLEE
jgi:hypothetical protein